MYCQIPQKQCQHAENNVLKLISTSWGWKIIIEEYHEGFQEGEQHKSHARDVVEKYKKEKGQVVIIKLPHLHTWRGEHS